MKHTLCLSFLLVCASLTAQPDSKPQIPAKDPGFLTNLTGEVYIEYRGYRGNQYYLNDWVKSDILLTTGEMIYDRELKYNGLLDEVIWLNTAIPGLFKLDKATISDFWLKNTPDNSLHFRRININESTNSHQADIFAEVGVEGKISFFIHHKVSILEEQTITRDGKLYPYKIIGPTPTYYLKINSGRYILLPRLNRKSLLKLFPDQKKDIVKLQKQNHINLKTESGFCEMIILLNK